MTSQNQKTFEDQLNREIDSLQKQYDDSKRLEATVSDQSTALLYNATASSVFDRLTSTKRLRQDFLNYCTPGGHELTERLTLMQNHAASLQTVLVSVRSGLTAVLDTIGVETAKLTESMVKLRNKCVEKPLAAEAANSD